METMILVAWRKRLKNRGGSNVLAIVFHPDRYSTILPFMRRWNRVPRIVLFTRKAWDQRGADPIAFVEKRSLSHAISTKENLRSMIL